MGSSSFFALGMAFLVLSCSNAQSIVKFGYSGQIGPMRWGSLCPSYSSCSQGRHQSPIDIAKLEAEFDPSLHPLLRDYASSNATLIDNGFNIMVKYEGNVGCVTVEGKNYTLKQMHWHSPSEHTIDGERFPMELHLVHMCDDGNVTVVAILFKYGTPNPFIAKLMGKVEEMTKDVHAGDKGAHIPIGLLNTKAMRHSAHGYYRYVGSLTTPPCTENVVWNVVSKVRDISKEQAEALMAPLEGEYRHNARPTQPLNGRRVRYYAQGPLQMPNKTK